MRTRPASLGLLLLLAACHRGPVAEVTLDEDAAAQNATHEKALADIAAAEAAARQPMPSRASIEPPPPPPPPEKKAAELKPAPLLPPVPATQLDPSPADNATTDVPPQF